MVLNAMTWGSLLGKATSEQVFEDEEGSHVDARAETGTMNAWQGVLHGRSEERVGVKQRDRRGRGRGADMVGLFPKPFHNSLKETHMCTYTNKH